MAKVVKAKWASNPIAFGRMLWPQYRLYNKQIEIVESVMNNDETYVPAAHKMGKDFVTAFIVLWFFLSRTPARVVTTSSDASQLEGVLWGEMRRFIGESKIPLDSEHGGSMIVNHLHLRKLLPNGRECGLSYVRGRVAAKGEGMAGHHLAGVADSVPRTLFIADEASGVDDESITRADTWAHRKLIIGNCYSNTPGCTLFRARVLQGDLLEELD